MSLSTIIFVVVVVVVVIVIVFSNFSHIGSNWTILVSKHIRISTADIYTHVQLSSNDRPDILKQFLHKISFFLILILLF